MSQEKPLKLEDLIPEAAEFTLGETTYRLRAVTAADEIWIRKNWGARTNEILTTGDMHEISRLVYRLLSDEDKAQFPPAKRTVFDEDGNQSETTVGGVVLLQERIVGPKAKIGVLHALLKTIGVSRPEVDPDESPEEKKTP